MKRDRWPGAALDLYLGNMDTGRVRQLAEEGNAHQAARRLCEADFYIGEFLTHNGKTPDGRQILQAAFTLSLELRAQAGAENRDRAAVPIEGGVRDQLIVQGRAPDRYRKAVIAFNNLLRT